MNNLNSFTEVWPQPWINKILIDYQSTEYEYVVFAIFIFLYGIFINYLINLSKGYRS